MSNKITKEEFIKKLEKIHPNSYKIIDDFIDTHTPINFKCNCGNIFKIEPRHLYKKERIGCFNCCYKKRKIPKEVNEEKFLEKMNLLYPK